MTLYSSAQRTTASASRVTALAARAKSTALARRPENALRSTGLPPSGSSFDRVTQIHVKRIADGRDEPFTAGQAARDPSPEPVGVNVLEDRAHALLARALAPARGLANEHHEQVSVVACLLGHHVGGAPDHVAEEDEELNQY